MNIRGETRLSVVFVLLVIATFHISCSSSTSPGGGDSEPATWFVDVNGSGDGSGGSWEDAFNDLQIAVLEADSGDEIWVVEGTYTGMTTRSVPVLQLEEGVKVYGGFDGTETTLAERDVANNPTRLDGEDNAYHVVVGAEGAVLDGFHITGGNADGTGDEGRGGGVFLDGVSMTISHCIIEDNVAYMGAGIFARGDDSTIMTTILRNNSAVFAEGPANGGGGIAAVNNSTMSIDDCWFFQNTSGRYGGALHIASSSVSVYESLFEDNSQTNANDNGGGVYVDNDNYTGRVPSFTDCEFDGNTGGYGAAMFLTECRVSIIGCYFHHNIATMAGGAIDTHYASVDLRHSRFILNEASGGGAVYFYYSLGDLPIDVFNCLFAENTASGTGGGVTLNGFSPAFSSCTFANNSANASGGLHLNSDETPSLTNCILWGNTSSYGGTQIGTGTSGDPNILSCCIDQAGYGTEGGSIRSDPLWVTGPDGDYYLSQTAAGELTDSPCLDAGSDLASLFLLDGYTTSTDQIGDTGTVDIGFHYKVLLVGMPRQAGEAGIGIRPN